MNTLSTPAPGVSGAAARWLMLGIALATGIFFVYTAWFGTYPALIQRSIMLGAVLSIVFLERIANTTRGGVLGACWTTVLWVAVLAGIGTCAFLVFNFEAIARSEGYYGQLEVVLASIMIAVLLIATWISFGPALPLIAILFLLYALFGRDMPDLLSHRGLTWSSLAAGNYLTTKGVLGLPLGVVTDVVVYFLIFSAFLATTGASTVFIRLAEKLVGGMRGGPAKIAVIGSGLMGTISGSAVANVAASGTFTIPMMRETGYKREFAGAVEAVASAGGQLMPPVMGAAVFIMADMLRVGFGTVMLAALVPALIYYANLFLVVDLEAGRLGLRGLKRKDMQPLGVILSRSGAMLIPLVILFGLVIMQYSPRFAALVSIGALILLNLLRREGRMSLRRLLAGITDGVINTAPIAVAVAVAGIVVGVVEVTGVGLNLASVMAKVADQSLILLLMLTMVSSIILGMGLPTVACYIILALIVAPIIIRLGVPPISAHLFVFYFGILSAITPPVALASFAAAGLSRSSPLHTSVVSLKLALPAFFMPYLFVLQPGLLFQGDFGALLAPLSSAIIAVVGFSAASVGYFRGQLGALQRLLFLSAGILVFSVDPVFSITGVLLMAGVIGYGEFRNHKAGQALSQNNE